MNTSMFWWNRLTPDQKSFIQSYAQSIGKWPIPTRSFVEWAICHTLWSKLPGWPNSEIVSLEEQTQRN